MCNLNSNKLHLDVLKNLRSKLQPCEQSETERSVNVQGSCKLCDHNELLLAILEKYLLIFPRAEEVSRFTREKYCALALDLQNTSSNKFTFLRQ